jgi:hypothetical protein
MKLRLWHYLLAFPAVWGLDSVLPGAALSVEAPTTPVSSQFQNDQVPLAPTKTTVASPTSPGPAVEMLADPPTRPADPESEAATPDPATPPDRQQPVSQLPEAQPATSPDPITSDSELSDAQPADPLDQVTSVSQLSDVQPTDWAFQALQSLVERYGCIAGYPDGTFRGNRAMTRYEFAAGLNACLERINQLTQQGTSTKDFITKQDLATVRQLQEQFAAELATLRGRVDALEARAPQLEAHQFSTTTKLNGEVIMALGGVAAGQGPQSSTAPFGNSRDIERNTIFGTRTRLTLYSTFTGEDRLVARLQTTNFTDLSNSTLTPEGSLAFSDSNPSNNLQLDDLYYFLPIGSKTTIYLAANAAGADDFANTLNNFLDGNGGSGALTNFGTRNSIYYFLNSTGIGVLHSFNKKLDVTLGYLATDAANPQAGSGFFNGPYGALAQLTWKPTPRLSVGLIYVHAYNNDISTGSTNANLVSATGLPVSTNSYSLGSSWRVSPKLTINSWVGYTAARVLGTGDGQIWQGAVALALPDFIKRGNLAGLIVGVEPKLTQLDSSVTQATGVTADRNTSLHVEGFYTFQVSNNIAITPGIIWLTAPNHDSRNNDLVIGVIRTTFRF